MRLTLLLIPLLVAAAAAAAPVIIMMAAEAPGRSTSRSDMGIERRVLS